MIEYKGVLHCEVYDFEESPDEIPKYPLSEPFSSRKIKMLSRPDGFMVTGTLLKDFSPISDLLLPELIVRLQLIGARLNLFD